MSEPIAPLSEILHRLSPVAIAVSGGVDSMTLTSVVRRSLGRKQMVAVHAVSAAVPAEATERVRSQAEQEDWSLRVIEAGEFEDPRYRANPVNRCFFCKTNLYGAIAGVTDWQILSGTNLDDLGEYRPGLDAARHHGVRHPFVEAGMRKSAVRALARSLGLVAIAELPSAPCLASRVETGIRIDPDELHFVHDIERLVSAQLDNVGERRSVRCRLRGDGVVVELDPASLYALAPGARSALEERIAVLAPVRYVGRPVAFAPYRVGSAFLVDRVASGE